MSSTFTSKRLYLRGLLRDVTPQILLKYLSCYGKVSEVKFIRDYAFVQFESSKDAQVVHDTYHNQPLLGKKITIQFARPLRKDMPSFTSSTSSDTLVPDVPEERPANPRNPARYPVIIMNLHRDVRWQELKDFGRLTGCLVAYCDLDQGRNGRGFIEYFTRKDAEKAIRTLDGRRLLGNEVRVVGWERSRSRTRRGRSRSRSVPDYHERSRRSCSPPRRSTRESPRDLYFSNGDSITTVYEPRSAYHYPPPPPPPYPYHTLDKQSRPYFCPEEAQSPYREMGYGWDTLHYYDYYNSGQYGEDRAGHSYGMAAYE
ncbi:hypothetical protein K443DRAFT_251761 [Laccaria amethystina LaAM-08-1]|uniref:RRM domain-containing protein n=1 Tax=Laccaria amethystina LaAM-08-1 TaxID=1095629 RepID=A0A0C9YFA9_9AGAR|nr:hypothetical protein K443DRAFT_251761 [Laccaria amethystina LaAM-08-1]